MLNPSTADADVDDHTIRKLIGFCTRLGFDSLEVTNLFSYRATDPKELRGNPYLGGTENDVALARSAEGAAIAGEPLLCAWGAEARRFSSRAAQVERILRASGVSLYALAFTSDGVPRHPLMLPYSCRLMPYVK